MFVELVCKCLSNGAHVTLVIQVGCDPEMRLLCILSLLRLNALNQSITPINTVSFHGSVWHSTNPSPTLAGKCSLFSSREPK